MESSFIVWHITGVTTIQCLSVVHSCKILKKGGKNHLQTPALCTNHIMTFVIIQSPLYPAALYTEADSNSS